MASIRALVDCSLAQALASSPPPHVQQQTPFKPWHKTKTTYAPQSQSFPSSLPPLSVFPFSYLISCSWLSDNVNNTSHYHAALAATSPTQATWPSYAHDQVASSHTSDTEAAVDLSALTSLPRTGLLCELVNNVEVWSMMRRAFTDKFGLPIISFPMLVDHREQIEGVDAQL